MRDVLEVLSKLPPACLVWEDGQAYIIHRGVMGRAEYPGTSEEGVVLWNFTHNVSPGQAAAMQIGSTLGWEAEGADLTLPGGDTTFIYSAPLQVMLTVQAHQEDDAARMAEKALDQLVAYLADTSHNHVLCVVRDGIIDLIEEKKHATDT